MSDGPEADETAGVERVFGVVANVVAGLATIVFGHLDDRTGPKRVILISLGALVGLGSCIFLLHDRGPVVFWIFGIVMILFVGLVQSASRSLPPSAPSAPFHLHLRRRAGA